MMTESITISILAIFVAVNTAFTALLWHAANKGNERMLKMVGDVKRTQESEVKRIQAMIDETAAVIVNALDSIELNSKTLKLHAKRLAGEIKTTSEDDQPVDKEIGE